MVNNMGLLRVTRNLISTLLLLATLTGCSSYENGDKVVATRNTTGWRNPGCTSHMDPRFECGVMYQLEEGDILTVNCNHGLGCEQNGYWRLINTYGTPGWVSGRAIEPYE